jgi:transcription termination factor Rho
VTEEQANSPAPKRRRRRRRRTPATQGSPASASAEAQAEGGAAAAPETDEATTGEPSKRTRRRRRRSGGGGESASGNGAAPAEGKAPRERVELRGVVELAGGPKGKGGRGKGGGGNSPAFLRQPGEDLAALKTDPEVPAALVRKYGLKDGMMVEGVGSRSGKKVPRLEELTLLDGQPPQETRQRRSFKKLTVIDPDFHYELGPFEQEGQLSMRVLDLLCPIGRGQRGLLVAPPRTGKTTLLMNVATAMQALYPDVHLIVLLIDERPEEATYWRRSVEHGEVYVSTMDQSPKNHVRLAEMVQARAERLVESGQEVVILLDSITRLTRAYNNVLGGKESRTMSGGLDARVFQKPKHFFGAARNTEDGGSLTIFASALIDTGSRMDQVIYEEFKGTGNMELTLDRRLADRRIFPAVSIENSATRKEEKLLTRTTLRKVNILRRVLSRLRPREAMEMLIDRLDRYPSNQEFLNAFSTDDV